MKKIKLLSLIALFAISLVGCKEEGLNTFLAEDSAAHFPGSPVDASKYPNYNSTEMVYYHYFTFLSAEVGAPKASFKIPVRVAGLTANHDRSIGVKFNPDKTTANPSEYRLIKAVVPANEIYGYIEIEVDYKRELDENSEDIFIEITDSEDLKRGTNEFVSCKVVYSNKLTPPSTTNERGTYNCFIKGTTYYTSTLATHYSPNAHKLILLCMGWEKLPGRLDQPYQVYFNYAAYAAKLKKFIDQWDIDHPDKPWIHDAGAFVGQKIQARDN